ncbi:hypothetical protein M431DRAFT_11247 [Trichoderma harzianum CBS 226.95]|uniref:Uncharacterized protein n=1 Tax=Trichoderma harzianum CBS 226.95 TaxID=983964 RepID=A0A2T3ZTG8_TRIHA|nr:hypothetical protein M431DRAFT_11247 [Trichoderma harzianum CBS 226.95]PTB48102.1 hypothetical protein M431DRAFT_11247 [Trichoderma harzianum CBS 226.95]
MKGSHAVVLAFGPKLCLDAYKNSPPEFRLSFSSILIAIVTRVSTSTSTSTSTSSNDDDEEEDYDIDDDTALSSGRKGQARQPAPAPAATTTTTTKKKKKKTKKKKKKKTMMMAMTTTTTMILLQAVAVKARYAVGSDEWVHYHFEMAGILARFAFLVALLVGGVWWLWTTKKGGRESGQDAVFSCPQCGCRLAVSPAQQQQQ